MKFFWRYVDARLDTEYRDETYRFFVTESLRGIPQQKFLTKSLLDLLSTEETPDAEEITKNVIEAAGITLK